MLTKFLVALILTAGVLGLPVTSPCQERDGNAALIKPYLEPANISRLEWQLMNFNIFWQGTLEAILQRGITQLEELLVVFFPELKKEANLLYVKFEFRPIGGGKSIVATYEAGRLSLSE